MKTLSGRRLATKAEQATATKALMAREREERRLAREAERVTGDTEFYTLPSLRPCPFCGSRPNLEQGQRRIDPNNPDQVRQPMPYARIDCRSDSPKAKRFKDYCYAWFGRSYVAENDADAAAMGHVKRAIRAWNRRAA